MNIKKYFSYDCLKLFTKILVKGYTSVKMMGHIDVKFDFSILFFRWREIVVKTLW